MSEEPKQESLHEPEEQEVDEQAPAIEDLAPEASEELADVKGGRRINM